MKSDSSVSRSSFWMWLVCGSAFALLSRLILPTF